MALVRTLELVTHVKVAYFAVVVVVVVVVPCRMFSSVFMILFLFLEQPW